MKIVVTDGYTVNPGDLGWESIEALGDVTHYARTHAKDVVERCRHADVILTNKTIISRQAINSLPELKLICVTATGYNVVDVKAASAKGVAVCNVPAYGAASVAQHVFALLLALTNVVVGNILSVAKGEWVNSPDWGYSRRPMMELDGKTMGIVGLGHIGSQVAKLARAFGMKVIYTGPADKHSNLADYTDLHSLFSKADVVTLHCPLTDNNKEFVNDELLKLMKRSAFFINTARGLLVKEAHLADALNNERIAGAALDVLSSEPPAADNPLLKAKNCIITPHNAWMTREARQRIIDITVRNLKAFLEGQPVNVIN